MPEPNTNKTSPNAAQETGWSGIEDYLGEIDKSQMKVLNEDIDALLIFAGLFSAVLTAFVVPSYLLLQPDNSQLTVQLLAHISAQLARFEIVPPFINSTASNPSASPAFQVSTSARWMNCLWLLSLIFSLSSALFGILAKQWIREYLMWKIVSAAPRENVLLRQLRNEAWEDWKVSGGISTIPALLELAVVLFFAGLVVLVWTLDTVVAIVITAAVSVVIIILCTVTVLPAVYRRCPYKSPTGWACIIIFEPLIWVVRCIVRWVFNSIIILRHTWRAIVRLDFSHKLAKVLRRRFVRSAVVPDEHEDDDEGSHADDELLECIWLPPFPRFSNWRERDLYIDDLGSSEISNINDIGYPYSYKTKVAKDICEVMPLVRALSWVRKGTEDPRLLNHVATSAESLHVDRVDTEARCYVFTYVLRKLYSAKSESKELLPLSKLKDQLRNKAYKTVGNGHKMFRGGIRSGSGHLDLQVDVLSLDPSDSWILSDLLLGDIMYALGNSSLDRQIMCMGLSQYFLFFFRYSREFDAGRTRLQKIYNDAIDSLSTSHQKLRSSGVHTMILELLCSVSEVHMAKGTKLISADGFRVSGRFIDNEMRLAVQMFDQNDGYSDPYARHQFVMMADLVIRSLNDCWMQDKDLMGTLLEKMSKAVTISLDKGYRNCGCYHPLPWVGSMLSCDSDQLRWLPSQLIRSFLDVLQRSQPASSSNNEDIRGREAFVMLNNRVEGLNPRPARGHSAIDAAADPAVLDSEVEPSGRILSESVATDPDAKDDTTAGAGDVDVQQGGNDNVAVPGSQSQAAQLSERISIPTGLPAEETQENRPLSHYQCNVTIRDVELAVPID